MAQEPARTPMRPPAKFYKLYPSNADNKDPVIDQLRTAIEDSGLDLAKISELSDVSTSTMWNWFYGSTRRPQHATVMAVTRAIGWDWKLVKVVGAPTLASPARKGKRSADTL